ncbi:sensor histidine kinase [Radiobacillus sp. PE A8.2]|uniref:sensor histidine kinase n=1 Tax=Radiobacillus sp. PE A8.2 TaxID=3380349 RepID=UPI0038903390
MNNISEAQTIENRSMLMKLMSEKIDSYVNQLELFSQSIYLEEIQVLLNQDIPSDPVKYINYKNFLFDKFKKWYSYMGIKSEVENIIFIRSDGKIVSSNPVNEEFKFKEMNWYKKAINNLGTPFIFGPNNRPYNHISNRDSSYTFSLVRKINNRIDNRIDRNDFGVLLIDFKIEDLANLFDNITTESKKKVYLINDHKEIIFSAEPSLIGQKLEIQPNENGYDGWIEHQGSKLFANEYYSDKTKWKLVTFDQMSEIKKHTIHFRHLILGVGLFGVLIAFLLAIFIAKRITNPLLALKNTMNRFEKGHFHQVPVKKIDEIGSLTNSFNSMTKKIQTLINDVYKLQITRKEAQIKALHSQINPHFLYNTLDSMSAIASLRGVPILSKMSKMLAGMFRYSISNGSQMVPLQEELDQVKRYIDIQKIQYDDKFDLTLSIAEALNQYLIPKLSIQPIIENSIYHGLELVQSGGKILIQATVHENEVIITIKDNGVGIPKTELKSIQEALVTRTDEDHIGLKNVMERVQLIYGSDYGITIMSEEDKGTTVIFRLPYM